MNYALILEMGVLQILSLFQTKKFHILYPYSFGIEMRDTFIHPIPDSTIVAWVTKVGKVLSRFQTETGQKPYPLISQGEGGGAAFCAVFQPCIGCQEGNPDFVPHSVFSSAGSDKKDSYVHNHSNTRLGFLVWNQVVASCSIFSIFYHLSDSAAKAARKVL